MSTEVFASIFPLIVIIIIFSREGVSAFGRTITILCSAVFIQYNLSIYMYRGYAQVYMYYPEWHSQAIIFVNLFLSMSVLGYYLNRVKFNPSQVWLSVRRQGGLFPYPWIVSFLIALAVFLLAAFSEGSVEEFLRSSEVRGAGQFEVGTFWSSLRAQSQILAVLLSGAGAAFVALAFSRPSGNQLYTHTVFVVVILSLLSSPLFFKFSRLSGGVFLLFSLVCLLLMHRQILKKVTCIAMVICGFYLSHVGLSDRQDSNPGFLNFVEASIFNEDLELDVYMSETISGGTVIDPSANFLDAMAPFTARAEASGGSGQVDFDSVAKLALIMQPLPSSIVGADNLRVGESLSVFLGRHGSTGITTPTLAELFVLLGWGGVLLGIPFGYFMKSVDYRVSVSPSVLTLGAFALLLAAILISGHNGIRSAARPLILSVFCILLYGHFNKGRVRKRSTSSLGSFSPDRGLGANAPIGRKGGG